MATVRDIVSASLREIGVLGAREAATYDDANDALSALNRLVDQYAAEPLTIHHITRTEVDIEANEPSYTVGKSGDSSSTVTDGFDTTWDTDTQPPDWTSVLTGSGSVANFTTVSQAGGHAVRLTAAPPPGTVTLYRGQQHQEDKHTFPAELFHKECEDDQKERPRKRQRV